MATEIRLALGELFIELKTDKDYPDCVQDMTNRVKELATAVMNELDAHGLDVNTLFELSEQHDDDDDEDEDED